MFVVAHEIVLFADGRCGQHSAVAALPLGNIKRRRRRRLTDAYKCRRLESRISRGVRDFLATPYSTPNCFILAKYRT